MKHGKKPTRAQKQVLKSMRLNADNWLVIKDTPEALTIIHRQSNQIREIIKRKEG